MKGYFPSSGFIMTTKSLKGSDWNSYNPGIFHLDPEITVLSHLPDIQSHLDSIKFSTTFLQIFYNKLIVEIKKKNLNK